MPKAKVKPEEVLEESVVEAESPEVKEKKKKEFSSEKAGFYKSYDIRWLKQLREEGNPHPDADHLIEEFEAEKEEK